MDNFTRHTDDFATCGQITPDDIPALAAQGFRTLINNRPDLEGGPAQPTSAALAEAATAHGLRYIHIPVVSGQPVSDEQAATMRRAIDSAEAPVLAFCRSGARSTNLWNSALAR